MAEQEQTNCWVDLLGPNLLNQEGTVSTADALKGKYVALYFSAHWCGPCRGFTPRLAEQYEKILAMDKNWEVVFCSSDSDDASFKSYFKDMPWLALPYSERDLKASLGNKYGVRGIPTLVLLDMEAGLITTGGRSKVMDADTFPWLPIPFEDCFKNVTADDFDITKGTKALYFSAHWCGPCRNFTPNLKKVYETLKAEGKDFEVVFVTSDRTNEQFDEYFAEMPWAAIPFDNKSEISSLEEKFDVNGIPALAVLQDGKLLNPSAVGTVRGAAGEPFDATKAAAAFPWKKEAVQELTMSTSSDLNSVPCVILFQDGLDADVQKANAAFLQNAAISDLEAELSGGERKMAYYTHNEEHERITKLLKGMMSEVNAGNCMIILHFGGQGAYYVAALPQSEDDVNKFVADFHAGKLERKQASPPNQ